jgi:hypothetical protein
MSRNSEDAGETQMPWDFKNEFFAGNSGHLLNAPEYDDRVFSPAEEVELLRGQHLVCFYERRTSA